MAMASASSLALRACEILLLLRAIGSVLFGEHRHVPTYGVLAERESGVAW